MFDLLARMYANGSATQATLDRAVIRGWITVAQRDEIVAGAVGVL